LVFLNLICRSSALVNVLAGLSVCLLVVESSSCGRSGEENLGIRITAGAEVEAKIDIDTG
jgi:hypothetical protein